MFGGMPGGMMPGNNPGMMPSGLPPMFGGMPGLFDKKDKNSYKYNNLHAFMETYFDNYMISLNKEIPSLMTIP